MPRQISETEQTLHAHFLARGENDMPAKFVMTKDKAGEFRFKLEAANSETIAVSEGYKTKQSCLDGIQSVRNNTPNAILDDKT